MPLAVFDAYHVSLFLHITAVMVGLGSTFALAITFPVAMKLGTRHLPYVHRLSLAINQRFALPGLFVVLLTGIYQTLDDERDFSFGDPWISATLAIVILIGGVSGAYFIPSDRRLGEMAEREIAAGGPDVELSEDYQRGARTQGIVGGLVGLLLVAAVFLMVTKPGA